MPMVRMMCKSSRKPTTNSRMAIPKWASNSISSAVVTIPIIAGPTRIPTAIKATISGWRSWMAIKPIKAEIPNNTLNSIKALSNIAFSILRLSTLNAETFFKQRLEVIGVMNHEGWTSQYAFIEEKE